MGATWPDLGLALIALAREDLSLFIVVTIGLALAGGMALAIMAFVLKIIVLGPLTRYRIDYNASRQKGRAERQERLPL